MIIDFHVHGKITSSFPFNPEDFLLTVNEAKENGLSALAITEHCHASNFLEGYNYLESTYNFLNDYYDVNGFKVFYGMEVTTKEKLDILIIGNPKLVLDLREQINSSLDVEKYININKLFSFDIPEELLIILAHPYRNYTVFPDLDYKIVERLDAIELNSKDVYKSGLETTRTNVEKLSNTLGLPIVCGSDTHHFMQISTAKNIFTKDCHTVMEIKQEIKQGNYSHQFSCDLKARVKSAIIIKKLIRGKK